MRAFYPLEAYGPYGTVTLVDPLARAATGYVEITRIKRSSDIFAEPVRTTFRMYFRRDNSNDPFNTPILIQDIMALVEEAVGPTSSATDSSRMIEIGDVKFFNNGVVSPHPQY